MYTPIHNTIIGSLTPALSVDVSLHTFLGVSWMILLPYTIFGGTIMVYSQARLFSGQRALKRVDRFEALNATMVPDES